MKKRDRTRLRITIAVLSVIIGATVALVISDTVASKAISPKASPLTFHNVSKFVDGFGHVFNVQLPSGRVVGMTAAHVCEAPGFPLAYRYIASGHDVCVLENPVLGIATFTEVVRASSGLDLYVSNRMWGEEPTVHTGKAWFLDSDGVLRSDIPIYPGFSGSAIFTEDFKLIGIDVAGIFVTGPKSDMSVQSMVEPLIDELVHIDEFLAMYPDLVIRPDALGGAK